MMTCLVHVVPDATHAWVTRESPRGVEFISFWYNPSSAMTMADVVFTIESTFGSLRIGHVTVRGLTMARRDLDNYRAAEYLKHGESFTCYLTPLLCCVLL